MFDRLHDIVSYGWTQRGYHRGNCVCLAGGIREVFSSYDQPNIHALFASLINPRPGDLGPEPIIWWWNDQLGRTKDEVLALIRRAEKAYYLDQVHALLAVDGGWMQGDYHNTAHTCFCTTGAVYNVSPDASTAEVLFSTLAAQLPDEERENITAEDELVHWNDTPGRTQAEVLDLIKKARAAC